MSRAWLAWFDANRARKPQVAFGRSNLAMRLFSPCIGGCFPHNVSHMYLSVSHVSGPWRIEGPDTHLISIRHDTHWIQYRYGSIFGDCIVIAIRERYKIRYAPRYAARVHETAGHAHRLWPCDGAALAWHSPVSPQCDLGCACTVSVGDPRLRGCDSACGARDLLPCGLLALWWAVCL